MEQHPARGGGVESLLRTRPGRRASKPAGRTAPVQRGGDEQKPLVLRREQPHGRSVTPETKHSPQPGERGDWWLQCRNPGPESRLSRRLTRRGPVPPKDLGWASSPRRLLIYLP